AVDLEKLQERQEVLDALALARALLNPHHRIAWLGVLRAPWCGLSLDDLHRLASTDETELLARPIPELLAERITLLSDEGQASASRVLRAMEFAHALRAAQPAASLGTWLEQVWLRIGGAGCVDTAGRANLELLWSCLDRLPGGEQDLLGSALDAALDKLTAMPDPAASSDYGVQLMTIHKAKGLEFEIVIVPELQAGASRGARRMLSWLERGLAKPDESGEITEFLVAPLQPKGADRGKAKEWVDCVYHERESQEMRRILYVAATRAREELHLFARPEYKTEKDGSLHLAEPRNSLLATAWPALEDEVRARFAEWSANQQATPVEIESLAASGDSNLLSMPSPLRATLLRRLPPEFQPQATLGEARAAAQTIAGNDSARLYARHEGGLLSRALGTAVHALLEELARLRTSRDWDAARAALRQLEPCIAAEARAIGASQPQAAAIAADALRHALNASNEMNGQWILSPHTQAASEVCWTGAVNGRLRTVRVDRVFQAGLAPGSEGTECWWIVDYKTTHADGLNAAAALAELRPLFSPQIEAYAQVLRNLHGNALPIRAALYYPRMLLLDHWEL
ncbi:MAG: 3'-5' exonuclease, partial [Acidobacteriota bacterium]